jgi:hypothetical protein
MSANYAVGQKVKIIEVKNQQLRSKYPKLKQYLSRMGIIVDSRIFGTAPSQNIPLLSAPSIYYFYTIRLDKSGSELKDIPEDALEAFEQE